MISSFLLENFKPFGTPQLAEFAPITLIYGPNSGGKSSIIQALMLIRQSLGISKTAGLTLIPRGELADLGSFKSLLHNHELSRPLGLTFEYPASPVRQMYGLRPPAQFLRSLGLEFVASKSPGSRRKDSSQLSRVTYRLDRGEVFDVTLTRLKDAPATMPAYLGVADQAMFDWADDATLRSFVDFLLLMERRRPPYRQLRNVITEEKPVSVSPQPLDESEYGRLANAFRQYYIGGAGPLPSRLIPKAHIVERDVADLERWFGRGRMTYALAFDAFSREFLQIVESMQYLGPLRSYPERHYLISGGKKSSVGPRGEETPQVIYRSPSSVNRDINQWFESFEIPYRLKIKPLGDAVTGEIVSMHLRDVRSKVDLAPSDVGFGIGQLLPILVQGLVSGGQILCVEQPEIHLHPRLQANLADFLIATSSSCESSRRHPQAGLGNQWIVETHSEALVLRLQRRIREGTLSPDRLSVLYVRTGEEGASEILRLRIDETGEFADTWPDGFFEESFNELMA